MWRSARTYKGKVALNKDMLSSIPSTKKCVPIFIQLIKQYLSNTVIIQISVLQLKELLESQTEVRRNVFYLLT